MDMKRLLKKGMAGALAVLTAAQLCGCSVATPVISELEDKSAKIVKDLLEFGIGLVKGSEDQEDTNADEESTAQNVDAEQPEAAEMTEEESIPDEDIAEDVFLQKLDKLVSDYGLFGKHQTGTMTTWQDEWFEAGGIMGAAIQDFDADEAPEMLVCISEMSEDHAEDGYYHIMVYMWECEEAEAVLADSVPFAAYIQSEYMDGNLSEVLFRAANWTEGIQALQIVQADGYSYLMCEDQELASAFADGSSRSYWLMSYRDGRLEYDASFTQTGGGSSDFAYTGYRFEKGALSSSDLYFSEWYEDNALFDNYGEALSSFWDDYGILVEESRRDDSSVYDTYEAFTSILSPDNDAASVFVFTNTLVSREYVGANFSTIAGFEANLTWGNELLEQYSRENGAETELSVTEAEEASEWDGASVVSGEKFSAQIFDEGTLILDLDANATTGYTWVITEETDIFASDYDMYVEPDNTSQGVGAGGIAEFHIIALKEGTGTMLFQYKRPWEGGEVAGTYALTLTISRNQSVLQIDSVSFEQIN